MSQFDDWIVFDLLLFLFEAKRYQTLIEVVLNHLKLYSQLFTPNFDFQLVANQSNGSRKQVKDISANDLCCDE